VNNETGTKNKAVKLSDLVPDNKNANRGSQRGRGLLEKSLRKYGAGRSLLIDKNNNVLAGNKTLEIAAELDLKIKTVETDGTELVVVKRTDLDIDSEAGRGLAIADNRTGEMGLEWDTNILLQLSDDVDLTEFWKSDELDKLAKGWRDTPDADIVPSIDKADELRKKWGVELGQLWQLGEHRIICGDCTDADVVARLMDGEKGELVFTDPPYGVNYEGGINPVTNKHKRAKLIGDVSGDLYFSGLKALKSACINTAPMYIWFNDSVGKPVYEAVEAIKYTVRSMIVWNKLAPRYGNFMAHYMQKHEVCLYIANGNVSWIGANNEVTVWDITQPKNNEFHPTQKPTELAIRAISNHQANIVLDFFSGSGTTLMACETLDRKCRAIDIEPKYIAVTLERWATYTGEQPKQHE